MQQSTVQTGLGSDITDIIQTARNGLLAAGQTKNFCSVINSVRSSEERSQSIVIALPLQKTEGLFKTYY